jgi:transitional endoplasmic reticulum ATPase
MSDEKRTLNTVAQVERFGEKIILPAKPREMPTREAADYLYKVAEQEEQMVDFVRKYEGYEPHDAAAAFTRVIEKTFGMVLSQTAVVDGFFGPVRVPPEIISFKIGLHESATIVLGQFGLPNIKGKINTSIQQERGANKPRYFMLTGEIQQKDRDLLNELADRVEQEVKTNSVFRGKQFGYRLKDDDGDYLKIPQITFLDTEKVINPIFPRDVEEQIEVSVYTPIEKTQRWLDAGLSLKRGVLFYGPFGTGKTLTSYTVAKKCRENNWTFMVCDRPDEFPEILRLARNYEPCVVFCEDIDRVMSGRRTLEMDEILNILDGIESKGAQIMVVVTTNAYEDINKAMLRAGRLDARIHIPLPDQYAVGRLLRSYGGGMIAEAEDISEACNILAGSVTASEVAEVITLAKGAAIEKDHDLGGSLVLDAQSLKYAARVVREQSDRSKEEKQDNLSNQEKAAHVLAAALEKHIDSTKVQPEYSNGHAAVVS